MSMFICAGFDSRMLYVRLDARSEYATKKLLLATAQGNQRTVKSKFLTVVQTFPARFLTAVMLFWYEMQKVLYDSISNFLKTNLKLYLIFLKR